MGALGKFGDTIEDVSSRIAKFSVGDFYNKYLVQTDDEIANVARKSLTKKTNASSMVDRDALLTQMNASTHSANKDYTSATSNLMKSLDNKDMEGANAIAKDISEKYKENKFLDELKKAETKKQKTVEYLQGASSSKIEDIYSDKVKIPKAFENFLDESDEQYVKSKAYELQGKKGYFNSKDKKVNRVRAGVVAGAYMTGMTTARLSHGGNLVENEYGERDIVGIPFI